MQFLNSHVSCPLWLLLGGFKQTWYHLEDWQLGQGHKFLVFWGGRLVVLWAQQLFCFLASQHKVVLPIEVIEVQWWSGTVREYSHWEHLKGIQFCCLWNNLILFFFNVSGENLFETSKVHELSGPRISYILLKLFSKLLLSCKCNSTMSLNAEVFGFFFYLGGEMLSNQEFYFCKNRS